MISKRLHPASFSNVNAQLAQIVNYTTTPIAVYTLTSNTEIVVSAVDTTLDTLTCVGHVLANGDIISPTMNDATGALYPLQVYAGGLTQRHYYVGVVDANTFKLYTDVARTELVDITVNATIDLTKWHFEREAVKSIAINGLSASQFFVRAKTKISVPGQFYIFPSAPHSWLTNKWISATEFGYPAMYGLHGGSLYAYHEAILISGSKVSTIKYQGLSLNVNNANPAAIANASSDAIWLSFEPDYLSNTLTGVTAIHVEGFFLNGTEIEVYKI